MNLLCFTCAAIFFSSFANAGVVEMGVSGNYRQSYYGYDSVNNKKNFNIYITTTGSLSYYFAEQSAIELSYTDGRNDELRAQYKTRTSIQMYGIDFMYTIGAKDSTIRPYFKLGVAYQLKKSTYQQGSIILDLGEIKGWSPSVGIGMRILFSQNFVFRSGLEAITSPIDNQSSNNQTGFEETDFDIAARVGISWMF